MNVAAPSAATEARPPGLGALGGLRVVRRPGATALSQGGRVFFELVGLGARSRSRPVLKSKRAAALAHVETPAEGRHRAEAAQRGFQFGRQTRSGSKYGTSRR